MKNMIRLMLMLFLPVAVMAQTTFEGTITLTYKNEKEKNVITQVKVKDNKAYIKQTENGNKKYDYFVVDLTTKDLYTVSTSDKKVVIKYNLDQLVEFYDANELKDGYKKDYGLDFKLTDKNSEINGVAATKAVADNAYLKATAWVTESSAPINKLLPFLRLIGSWNEIQGTSQTVIEGEVNSKVNKKETSVKAAIKKETVSKDAFELPKDYLQKDFAQLMNDKKNNKDLKSLIKAFAEF